MAAPPFLPWLAGMPSVLRWLPLGAGAYGVLVAAVLWHTLIEDYGVRNEAAGTLALGFATAIGLCLWWATPAWWLSLGSAVLTAVVAHEVAVESVWPAPVLVAHVSVLALRGLQTRPRELAEMWLITLAAGLTLTLLIDRPEEGGLVYMSLLSGMVLVVAGAVRARGEALGRLARMRRESRMEAERVLLEERARIARELHDVVAHHMSVIAVQAEAAPYRAANVPPELAESLSVIRAGALEALTELHRILGLLRDGGPEQAEPQPTVDRLDRLVARMAETGVRATLEVRGTPGPVSPDVGLAAYRIVQEALSNVVRHAPGARVHVTVAYLPGVLEVSVGNDRPTGPPPRLEGTPSRPGHGLLGMRERAAALGGTVAAGPRPDGGHSVVARLPLRERNGVGEVR